MNITIENVAAPSGSGKSRGKPKTEFTLALELLQVGQSFFLSKPTSKPEAYLRVRASMIGKRLGWKFCVNGRTENGVEGLRFYRVE